MATTISTERATCGYCGDIYGLGEVEVRHPLWGAPNCPEPTVTVPCPKCQPAEYESARNGGRF